MILLAAHLPRSAFVLYLALAATCVVSTKSQVAPSRPFEMYGEEEDLFEQSLIDSSRTEEVDRKPKKDEREPCEGIFISDKGNRFSDCGPWRLKKRAPPPPKGSWPFPKLVEQAAVPKRKHDADFLGWIWVFGAWEHNLFKMVSVDRDGKKIEDRYSKRKDINETFMPDILTADELQPYWDIAVREGESPDERPDFHPPPGEYAAEVEVYCKKDTHHCDETLYGRKGVGYRGCQSFTRHGEPCQKWTDQSPITHNNTPEKRPGTGLGDHNFCRNPDGMQTIWCYIAKENMNADRRRACKKNPEPHRGALWEWCLPLVTYVDPDQTTTTTTTVCQPLGDFTFRMLKKDAACHARDRHFMGRFTRQRCAEAVRANGYKYFNWVKWCATGNCQAVGTKSGKCREGWRKSTKFDFFEINELGHHKQAYVKHKLIKTGNKCKSGEAFLGWMSSVPACANAVKGDGGKFFSYGNGQAHTAGACYKEDTKSSSCSEGWQKDANFDFYVLDGTAKTPSHSGAECFHSQCCHSEGSAPCTWCGGEDWYCCDATRKYPSGDKCANVEIINKTKHWRHDKLSMGIKYRCAKLKSSSSPSPSPSPSPVPRPRSRPRPRPRRPKPTKPPTSPPTTTTAAPTPTSPSPSPVPRPRSRPRPRPRPRPPKPTKPPTAPPTTTTAAPTPPTVVPTAAPTPAPEPPTPVPTQPKNRRRRRGGGSGKKGGKKVGKKGPSRRRRGKKGPSRRRRGKKGPSRRRRGKGLKKAPAPSKV